MLVHLTIFGVSLSLFQSPVLEPRQTQINDHRELRTTQTHENCNCDSTNATVCRYINYLVIRAWKLETE